MVYINKLHHIPYSKYAALKKRKSYYLLCFADDSDQLSRKVIKLAKSRCEKYQMVECSFLNWDEYMKNIEGCVETEKYCLFLYLCGKIQDYSKSVSKNEFNRLFSIANKSGSIDKHMNHGLHLIRQSSLGTYFINNTLKTESEYISPKSEGSSPDSLDLNKSRQLNIPAELPQSTNNQTSSQTHPNFPLPRCEQRMNTSISTNIEPSYPLPLSSYYPRTYNSFRPTEQSMFHSHLHTSDMHQNPLLSHRTQQYSHTIPHTLIPSPMHLYPQYSPILPASSHLMHLSYSSEQTQTAPCSSFHPLQQYEQRRPLNQSPAHPPTPTTLKHSIHSIFESSSSTSHIPKIFTHDEDRSPFSRPKPSSSTQLGLTAPLFSFRLPSHSFGSSSEILRSSSTQSTSTTTVLHQPLKDTTSSSTHSTGSIGKAISSLSSSTLHQTTPYSRPRSRTGRQASHTITNTERATPNSPRRQMSITGYMLNLSHRENRTENNNNTPSSTHLRRQGRRTTSTRSNRSPNRQGSNNYPY